MTFDDTWESVSCWGMVPTDPGKLERVAWKIALADCRDEPDGRVAGFKLAMGAGHYRKLAQAAIRAYERYDGRERATDWELVV